MTVVSILDHCVQAAVGRSGKRAAVKALYHVPYDHLMDNGWEEAVATLWRDHDLPRRGVTLVLPRQAAFTKILTLPAMGEKQTLEAIGWELHSAEEEESVTDFLPLAAEGKRRRLLAVRCRRSTMESFVTAFSRLGIELSRITVPTESVLKLLSAMKDLHRETCLWLLFDGTAVVTVLAQRGEYRYLGQGRINARRGSPEFPSEITRIVSGTMQFQSSEWYGDPITHVYFGGCSEEDFLPCIPPLEELGLCTAPLPLCRSFTSFPEGESLGDWVFCAGSLLRK